MPIAVEWIELGRVLRIHQHGVNALQDIARLLEDTQG
jgi:hypothetical protein